MALETPVRAVRHPAPVGRIVMIGTVFGAAAGLLDLIVYAVGRLVGVPFEVVRPGAAVPALVPWWLVPLGAVAAGVAGGLLASLARALPTGPTVVLQAGLVLGVLSLAYPILQPASVPWSTRLWLAALHLVATLVIVPAVARGVTSDDPPPGLVPR